MDSAVRVRKASSAADFADFLALPWKIYRNDRKKYRIFSKPIA